MHLPLDLSGEVLHRCTLKSSWGQSQPERENRVLVCCAFPWQHTSENRLWCGAIWMWKYASFKSTDANQSPGRICTRICFSVNILNGRLPSALLMGLRSRIGRSPQSLLGTPNSGWTKQQSRLHAETCSIALSPSNLHSSCFRIRAFRVSVRDYATPLKRGGLRLNWRV